MLNKLFNSIGKFFEGLFNAASKTWNKLSPELQKSLLHGSEIVNTINQNLDAAPAVVIYLLQKKFPDLTIEKIRSGLLEVDKALKIAEGINDPDLETLIQKLQVYLSGLKGKIWASISHSVAAIISIALAPPETKFAAIAALMEYVYHRFIKKDE